MISNITRMTATRFQAISFRGRQAVEGGERFIITSRGVDRFALVSLEDVEILELLDKAASIRVKVRGK